MKRPGQIIITVRCRPRGLEMLSLRAWEQARSLEPGLTAVLDMAMREGQRSAQDAKDDDPESVFVEQPERKGNLWH